MLTNYRTPLAGLLMLLCPWSLAGQSAPCPAYTMSLSLNTGADSAGSPLPGGAPDPRWTVLEDPFASTVEPRPADVLINPSSAWAPLAPGQWISTQPDSMQTTNGEYFYRSCFCLRDGFSRSVLRLEVRADDQADVFLNNTMAQIKSSTPPAPILQGAISSFSSSKPPDRLPAYTGPFKFGENCLIVRVKNTGGVVTGLNLTGSITAAGPNGAGGGLLRPECCNPTGSICGMKWNDLNHDGVRQSTEPGLPGWIIQLGNGQTESTDQFGNYCFSGLAPGSYTVTEKAQPGWTQTLPKPPGSHSVTVGAATATGGLDFGNCQGPECGPRPSCMLTGNIVSGCCLGPVPCPGSSAASSFYSFLASVTLSGAASCSLTATSTTTGLVIGSQGPATLNAGANFVTGTFSAPQTSSPFGLTLSCQGSGGVQCSTTLNAPLPDCRPTPAPVP